MKKSWANLNLCWADLLIEELHRCGIRHISISPGSRSSPLAIALANNKRMSKLMHFDERGAGFHALGYSRASGQPAAVITTSGSAAANLWPAVVEAAADRIPLILITADRPPELRDAGANQTIDQAKMFGGYANWQVDLPCPDANISPHVVLTTFDQAVYRATRSPRGPVHVNCMFREPLAPIPDGVNTARYVVPVKRWMKSKGPWTSYAQPGSEVSEDVHEQVRAIIKKTTRGLIVAGPLRDQRSVADVVTLAQKLGWPLCPDIQSGMRLGKSKDLVIHHADQILHSKRFADGDRVDTVLHFGGRPVSKRLHDFLHAVRPDRYLMIDDHPRRADPGHLVSIRIESDVGSFCRRLSKKVTSRGNAAWAKRWVAANKTVNKTLSSFEQNGRDLNEPLVSRLVARHAPREHAIFLGSSMPIRDMDMFAPCDSNHHMVAANRGASGIDGNVATAAGFSLGARRPVTLVLGDLALLHDLNSLSLLRSVRHPVIVIVVNNNGGGIFSFLPISAFSDVFEPLFGTPQNITFEHAAGMFNLSYARPESKLSFIKAYADACRSGASALIEVCTNRSENYALHISLQKKIAASLRAVRRR